MLVMMWEKDLRHKRKKTRGEVSKIEEASTDEKDDAVIEKKLKRKKSNEKLLKNDAVTIHNDDGTEVEKKLKSKRSRKELSELDIIDSGQVSFADLFSVDTMENPKHNNEIPLSPAVEVGMGGPSTWADD
ncbi:hypothetical protein OIU74_004259 [Salix koriyanagi]|uniref:Uncharacterized protein n=1 Tax=Salix koriyanagi TaxID=2511006 RepID=A0A9Q0ZM11_9ROSI|nr:hypothetical protein OIU74_004259 [Salix koriyanagi]